MPLYEYQCEECDHRFEVIQRLSDPPLEKCPKCGGPVRKLVSSPAIQFKGSGWYITDYAKKDQAATKSDDGAGKEAKEKSDKADKGDKADKAEKTDKSSAAGSSSSTTTASASSSSSSASTKTSS